jgi:hypothetical protein
MGENYKLNPLKQVICRLDFKNILSDNIFNNPKLYSAILIDFKQKLADNIVNDHHFDINNTNNTVDIKSRVNEFVEKTYIDNEGYNRVIISQRCLLLIINKYENYEKIKNMLSHIIEVLRNDEKLIVSRFGLRYINIFNKDNIRPLKLYFADCIGELLSVNTQGELKLSRSILFNEYINENIRLTAQYGKPNNNFYPGALNPLDTDFTLDYDAYIQGDYFITDILNSILPKAHSMIQQRFELDITDKLRGKMNGK